MKTKIITVLVLLAGFASPGAAQKGPLTWVESTREEPPGMKYKTYHSKTIDGLVSYLIYLPPDYDRETTKRYPVLYFLPGGFSDQRVGKELVQVLDDAIRKGKISPLIVVSLHAPIGCNWTDSSDGKRPVETVIIKDLIPHVDKTCRTIATREGRWLEGFSIGGRGAAHLGFEYPELFGAVSVLAGALMDANFWPQFQGGRAYQSVYGGKQEYFDKHDPITLVKKNADAIRGKTVVRIMVGDADTMGSEVKGYSCFKANKEFHEHLDHLKIPHEYIEAPGVKHGYPGLFQKTGDRALDFYKKAFENVGQVKGLPEGKAPVEGNNGRLKSVDVEKNTITVTVGDKDQVFSVVGAKLLRPDGGNVPGGLKAVKSFLEKQTLTVALKTEKKEGKEVVTEVRLQPAVSNQESGIRNQF